MAAAATASANDKKIFVGNLDFKVTEADLKLLFECSVGPVEGVNIRRDRETKRPKGFAFITFSHAADAKRALDTMQGVVHLGRTLTIKPQIARGTKAEGGGGGARRQKYKKPSLWGDKSNDGWFTPTATARDSPAAPVPSAVATTAGGCASPAAASHPEKKQSEAVSQSAVTE